MKITVINTGGTFNKVYNPICGELIVPTHHLALQKILNVSYNTEIEVINTLSKDSLEFTQQDREMLVNIIKESEEENIIVIHGTDTMYESASFTAQNIVNKKIIFTGAMIPMSIDEVEATMNFSLALGFLNAPISSGVYIAMHGAVDRFECLVKNKQEGKFLRKN
ncbi:MAG: asparaginase domain-containing protein [Arcobacteraceae bacterium]